MAEMPHMRRREGDEYFCPRCSKRWSVNEEDPGTCLEDRRELRDTQTHQYRRTAGRIPLTPANDELREQIQRIWREVNGHPEFVCLAASEPEWAFFQKLLTASPDGEY